MVFAPNQVVEVDVVALMLLRTVVVPMMEKKTKWMVGPEVVGVEHRRLRAYKLVAPDRLCHWK